MTHLDYSKISSNFTTATSNILEGHILDAKNSNITYTNNLRTDINKLIAEEQENIILPIPGTLTHTYVYNSNLAGEIRFWVKSAPTGIIDIGDPFLPPNIDPFAFPKARVKIDIDGKLKLYYIYDPLINLTWGSGWIDPANQIIGLIADSVNQGIALAGLEGQINLNYTSLDNKILGILIGMLDNDIITSAVYEEIADNLTGIRTSTTSTQLNAFRATISNTYRGINPRNALYPNASGIPALIGNAPRIIQRAGESINALIASTPAIGIAVGVGGTLVGIFYGIIQNSYAIQFLETTVMSQISSNVNLTPQEKEQAKYDVNALTLQYLAEMMYTQHHINRRQGFINSNETEPQNIPSINTSNIVLNGTNVNNIFLSQNGGSMYNSLVFQKNTSGNPVPGFFDGPGSRVIYEPSTTTLDYACSMGINNTTKNMWFSTSSNYGYQWWINGVNMMSLSSTGNLTINNGSTTEERQYPPKAYTSSTNESVITYLGQAGMLSSTITLNSIGITYGSGIYEIYSSSRYNPSDYQKRDLFNYATTTNEVGGHWASGQYTQFGVYQGVAYIKPDYLGDFLVVKLPNPIILTKFRFYPRLGLNNRIPGEFKFYGSMNNIDFTEITQASQITPRLTTNDIVNGYYEKTLSIGFNTPYLYIGFAVNKLIGTSGFPDCVNFQEFQIYGKEVINNTASFNGVGSFITELDYNNITLNKPATFPPTMTNIYSKTETDTLLNTKQPNLTFQSPLINTANTITLNTTNLITTSGNQSINGNLSITGTITENTKTIPTIVQETVLTLMPRVSKRTLLTATCQTSILMPNGISYFKRDLDLRNYTQTRTIPNPNTPYRIFTIKIWVASGYFGYLTNLKPNVISYEVYMSMQTQGGGGGIGSAGLNITAIGYPENYQLNSIAGTQLNLVCGDFNFVSVLSTVNGTVFNCLITDELF
jgi:hypothetical protein